MHLRASGPATISRKFLCIPVHATQVSYTKLRSGERSWAQQSSGTAEKPSQRPVVGCSLISAIWRAPRQRRCTATAALQGICFDRACQDAQDQIFLTVIAVPLLCLAAAITYAFLRPSDKDGVFEDPATGAVFESTDGATPQRDDKGELAFRAVSYTPWPVEEDFEGERLRLRVGAISDRQPRTYVFSKTLGQPSTIVAATLPRPLGVVFEEDARRKRVVVSGFLDGSPAARLADKARLDRSGAGAAPAVGDVLRAVTCTNFVYPTKSLFGAKPPQRTIVVYGADGERWSQVVTALKRGDRADGDVTLVLERALPREAGPA